MCIQRHPCRYKCFQNYSELYQQFPIQNVQNSSPCKCGGNNMPCFNGCYQNCQPCIQPKKQNKYTFCMQGTIKFDGFC